MNTCDGCKHWRRHTLTHDNETLLGDCESPKFFKGYGFEAEEIVPDGVHVENDEGWALATAPKFGCVHWEAKEPEVFAGSGFDHFANRILP